MSLKSWNCKPWIATGLLCFALAACGRTVGDQALIGGAAGVGAGVVTGGSVVTGGLVGAAANVAYCQANPHNCR